MAQAIHNKNGTASKVLISGVVGNTNFLDGFIPGLVGPLSEREQLDREQASHKPKWRYCQTEAYRRSNFAYDIVQSFIKAWRCQGQPTQRRLSLMGVGNLQEFLSLMQAKASFSIDLRSYGHSWCFDHIRPLSTFDFGDQTQVAVAVHYSNLQAMTVYANTRKGKRWLCPKKNPFLPGL